MLTCQLPDPDPVSVRPSRFSHIVLQTNGNLDAMLDWYKTVLHCKPILEIPGMGGFLTYDEEHHRVLIVNNPDAKPHDPDTVGLVHFAYAFENFEQLSNAYVRLKAQGIAPRECINHGFTLSFYYNDPDGNDVELATDVFTTREDLKAWMETGKLAQNPIGCFVDPDDMTERFRNGEPASVLLRDTYEGQPMIVPKQLQPAEEN